MYCLNYLAHCNIQGMNLKVPFFFISVLNADGKLLLPTYISGAICNQTKLKTVTCISHYFCQYTVIKLLYHLILDRIGHPIVSMLNRMQ